MSVLVSIANDKNTGQDPKTTVTINTDENFNQIGKLTFDPKPSSFPQILATNISFDKNRTKTTFQDSSLNQIAIGSGEYKNFTSGGTGDALDISECFLSARSW